MAMWIKDENGNPLKVKAVFKSKNLFNVKSLTFNWNKKYVTVNPDGSLTVNAYNVGTKESLSYYAPKLKANTAYTLSLKIDSDSPYIYLYGTKRVWRSGQSLVLTQADLDGEFNFYGSNSIYTNPLPTPTTIWDIMINKGDPLPYEPYFPLTKFKAIPKSRNALDIADYTGTHFGVTIDIKDGVISLSGTSERAADIWIKLNKPIKAGTYSNNGFTDGAMFFICKEYGDWENRQYLRESVSNILPYDCTYGLIYFDGGITFDKKIKIMLNKGDPLPYEPPQEIWL